MCDNFKEKQTTLTFSDPGLPKSYLELKIRKTNVVIRINILEIPCVPIFRQNWQLLLFEPKFAQKWILGSEFQKSKSGFRINTSNIPCVPIFSQNGQLLIFWPKFGEIAQLRAIFWFKYCWGCCRELGGGWNELRGGGWSWVELGAWFSNALVKAVLHTRLNLYWESSGGSRFVTQSLLMLYKWSQTRCTSCTNLMFPLNKFYQSVPIPIQNNMHCWWIEIKKSPKYKLNDNIGDLLTTFWYHSNDIKRNL